MSSNSWLICSTINMLFALITVGKSAVDTSQMEFEAKSARDGAWSVAFATD